MFGLSKKDFIYVILLNVFWGSAFAIANYAFKYFSVVFLYSLRFLIAGFISVLFFRIKSKKNFKKIFLMGCCQALAYIGIALGNKYLSSSIAAIVTRLDIITTIIFGVFIYKEKLHKNLVVGLIICIIAMIILNRDIKVDNIFWFIFLILTTFGYGYMNILSKDVKNENQFAVVGYTSVFSGILLFIVAAFFEWGNFITPFAYSIFENVADNKLEILKLLSCVLYGGLLVSFYFYIILFDLLKRNPSTKIMPYSFIRPVVALFAGLIIVGEPITFNKVIGILLICCGILLSQWNVSKKELKKIQED
jgi:O-acetylserine/cysteine efflux transporter